MKHCLWFAFIVGIVVFFGTVLPSEGQAGEEKLPKSKKLVRVQKEVKAIEKEIRLVEKGEHESVQALAKECDAVGAQVEAVLEEWDKVSEKLDENTCQELIKRIQAAPDKRIDSYMCIPNGMTQADFAVCVETAQKLVKLQIHYDEVDRQLSTKMNEVIIDLESKLESPSEQLAKLLLEYQDKVLLQTLSHCNGYEDPKAEFPAQELTAETKSLQKTYYKDFSWSESGVSSALKNAWENLRPCLPRKVREKVQETRKTDIESTPIATAPGDPSQGVDPETLFQQGEKWATADHGQGTQDWNKAIRYFRQAAERGHLRAMVSLGRCYCNGTGVKQDFNEAVNWFRKAADQGEPWALYILGNAYESGKGVNKDEAEAKRLYERCFQTCNAQKDSNDPWIQCLLSNCYYYGAGVGKNITEFLKWSRKAAEQGHAPAQCDLGICYEYGDGVGKDFSEAVKWYRKAAEQGFTRAQCNLGICYEYGTGVGKDINEAANWYRKAAEQGYARAQCNLGYCYEHGNGVRKDRTVAVKWYRKSAEQGFARAQYNLGFSYEHGNGVRRDHAQAMKWYRKAAEQGYAPASKALNTPHRSSKKARNRR